MTLIDVNLRKLAPDRIYAIVNYRRFSLIFVKFFFNFFRTSKNVQKNQKSSLNVKKRQRCQKTSCLTRQVNLRQ